MPEAPPSDFFTRRVCLRLDGMEAVPVSRDIPFGTPERNLRFDLYSPPAASPGLKTRLHVRKAPTNGRRPAVIIAAGYPGTLQPRPTTLSYKEFGWTVSMCQLIALSGMVAIAYTNREPAADLEMLLDHIHDSAATLRIDPLRLAVIGASGNAPTALTTIMKDARRTPVCAAFLYGCLLDLDGAEDVADAARQFGFANPTAGRTVADLRRDVPLLITRAGRDQLPAMNASIDRFVGHALVENLPITLVNHAQGPHAYDLFDDSRTSRDVIRQTLQFLRQHLAD